jgi:hypothetical protein
MSKQGFARQYQLIQLSDRREAKAPVHPKHHQGKKENV